MSRIRTAIAVVAAALLPLGLTACASDGGDKKESSAASKEITVTHAQGETKVKTNPEKVVVLDFGVLDTLDALGVDSVVGLPKQALPKFLSEYGGDKYTDIGTMQEPDMEKIAELDPDLILIGGRTAEKYAELNALAPTLDLTVSSADFMPAFAEVSKNLGEIFGKSDVVTSELAKIDDQIAETKKSSADAGKGLIVLVSGGKLSAFGPGSRFGFVHDVLGVPAASTDLKVDRHGQAISFEFIAQTNPQQLFVIDRDAAIGQPAGEGAKEVLSNDLVGQTDAAKNKKITYLDGARWYVVGAGLNNVSAMIDEISTSVK